MENSRKRRILSIYRQYYSELTGQLNHWIQNNDLQNNEEQFHMYTRKIYAVDAEEVSHRVHLRLYNHIKYNLRNIVEYEFSF